MESNHSFPRMRVVLTVTLKPHFILTMQRYKKYLIIPNFLLSFFHIWVFDKIRTCVNKCHKLAPKPLGHEHHIKKIGIHSLRNYEIRTHDSPPLEVCFNHLAKFRKLVCCWIPFCQGTWTRTKNSVSPKHVVYLLTYTLS